MSVMGDLSPIIVKVVSYYFEIPLIPIVSNHNQTCYIKTTFMFKHTQDGYFL